MKVGVGQARPSWAERTQEVAPQGSAFGALAAKAPNRSVDSNQRTFSDSARGVRHRLTGGMSVCFMNRARTHRPLLGTTQTRGSKPTPPLPTGSGAHGLRRQVKAPAGVPASRHALAECVPVRTVDACLPWT